jgi:hypothetical protein
MDSDTVRERTAGMVIGSALILKTSLGHDSPGVLDLLDVELPRVLSIPHIFKYVPEYRHISSSIARDIQAAPWERERDLETLLREWAEEVASNERFDASDIVEIIEEYAFSSDISTFSILRRGLRPITDTDVMMQFIDEACDILDVNIDMVYLMVMDVYNSLFTQIQ